MTRSEILELIRAETQFRTGLGFDVHQFADGRRMVLGGVEIPHSHGLLGHSDADALTHAAMDAVLGAAGMPDIGHFFPDTDARFKDADSIELAREVGRAVAAQGYELVNLDVMVLAEAPRLAPHRDQMRANLASAFGVPVEQVAVKATTMEKMSFIGRREGVAVIASAFLRRRNEP